MAQLALALPIPHAVAAPQRVLLPDPRDQAVAESRLAVLSPILMYRADPERFAQLQLKDGSPVRSFSRMVVYVAETNPGVSDRTLRNWLQRYRQGGFAALADKVRSDKQESRFFKAYPKAAWLAAYLFLECRQSATVAYEAIVRDAAMIDVPRRELPSYETVRAFLRSAPPSLVTYAREGRKAYQDRMSPYLKRGFTDAYANQVYVGDQMIHDVEAWNDCFAEAEWGDPIRIRLDAMLDYRSRLFVGATFCWEGSSRSIAATMRRAIAKYGPPEIWYVDNGLPYKKCAKGALPGYLMESPLAPQGWRKAEIESIEATGFLARLGIATQHCLPFHPQAKCIERAFKTVHERFDKCWPTYTSGSPFTRPDATSEAMMCHRKLLKKGQLSKSGHPPASAVISACLAWMEEYADTPHDGEGMDGGTPRQVFEANLNPRQKPAPEPAVLALLMAEHERRNVRECAITLQKRRYIPADQDGWATLHGLNEMEVLVAYDPADLDEVAALDLDGHFLASLKREELVRFAPGDPQTQEQIAESMAQRRHLEKATRDTLTTISLVARSNGAQSPLESLASRLQLPADTTLSDVVTTRPRKFTAIEAPTAPPTPAEAARIFLRRSQDDGRSNE